MIWDITLKTVFFLKNHIALYCIVLYCIVSKKSYCIGQKKNKKSSKIILYCIVLYYIVLYPTKNGQKTPLFQIFGQKTPLFQISGQKRHFFKFPAKKRDFFDFFFPQKSYCIRKKITKNTQKSYCIALYCIVL